MGKLTVYIVSDQAILTQKGVDKHIVYKQTTIITFTTHVKPTLPYMN